MKEIHVNLTEKSWQRAQETLAALAAKKAGAVGAGAGKGQGAFKNFEGAVAHYHASGLSPAAAVAMAAREHEDLHDHYVARLRAGTAEKLFYE